MQKTYCFKEFENKIDQLWYKAGVFSPEYKKNTKKDPFVIVIPPPNVTGVLHMGHALNNNIQDVLVRYKRMKGHPTVWVPGTDHAGIATQQVVERKLQKEGKSRKSVGREEFVKLTHKHSESCKKEIIQQLRKLGASCDWQRERFTLDEGLSEAVREVFVSLYEKGLIYKGDYLVNWSVGAGTALSDDEVEYKELKGKLYHIFYPFVDETLDNSYVDKKGNTHTEKGVVIATTRPETMLGDVAVAVHPKDERYKHLVGKELYLPLTNRVIPIVADEFVKSDFGSGAVKVTPAHDPNDYEMGKRHKLTQINILNTDGTLNKNVPEKYRGQTVQEARVDVCEDLEKQGNLLHVEEHVHQVGHCYRTGTVVEPMLSTQWFVKMKDMAQQALKAWEEEKIVFHPKRWENTFVHWLNNIKDWCISRQLWWGHRIPVWYNKQTGEMKVSRKNISSEDFYQEEDVLDTWFSSWLWPFSVFGWPQNTEDLQKYYPTTTLVTAYDIIFFWVARMVMVGLEFQKKVPFKDIYIHGLVRDDKGRKMSKSLGNGINPLDIIEEYGADALRFTLMFLCKLGSDVLINRNNFQLGSRFCNKVWNASRFVLLSVDKKNIDLSIIQNDILDVSLLTSVDKWMFSQLQKTIKSVENAFQSYRIDEAAKTVYGYFWYDFCDWYVEICKELLKTEDKKRVTNVLVWFLDKNIKLLHPFMPFITEEIYSHITTLLGEEYTLLAGLDYPEYKSFEYGEDVEKFSILKELVTEVRTLRSEFSLSPQLKIDFLITAENETLQSYFSQQQNNIKNLTNAKEVFLDKKEVSLYKNSDAVGVGSRGFEVQVYIKPLIDVHKEKQRLKKRIDKKNIQLSEITNRLNNKGFITKATEEYVNQTQKQAEDIKETLGKLESFYKVLEN